MIIQKEKHDKHPTSSPHLIKRPFKNHQYRDQRILKHGEKAKRSSDNTGKVSIDKNLIISHQKKLGKEKKTVKASNVLDFPENQSFFDLEHQYHKEINEEGQEVKWLFPKDEGSQHNFTTFPQFISEADFANLNNLKLNFLHYVCKRRIIRDQEFEFIYEGMVIKFPEKEEEIKQIMAEVLAVLDS